MSDEQRVSTTHRERVRWPLLRAAIMCPFRPATAARWIEHVSLLRAYLVHLLAVVLTFVAIGFLVAVSEGREISSLASDFPEDSDREVLLGIGITFAFIELVFLLLAWLLTPWGAQDERVRSSYRHALRQTWVHTSHAIPMALIIGSCAITLDQFGHTLKVDYWQASSFYPWHMLYRDLIVLYVVFVCIFWFLWALLRAVGADRVPSQLARPPTCEACGYNLTLQPMDSRCPECGEAVSASLGPEARPGPPWQWRNNIGRLAAWWQTTRAAILRPRRFGRSLRFANSRTDPVRFLLAHLPVVWLIVAGFLLYVPLRRSRTASGFECCLSASLAVLAVSAVTSFAALLAGVSQRLSYKRNLMPIAVQAASYLSGYATACVALFLTIIALGNSRPVQRWFQAHTIFDIGGNDLYMFTVLLIAAAVTAGYFVLISIATAAGRYANR